MTPEALPGARRVLLVDDSRTIRALLRAAIDADPRLTVVGEANDPYEARDRIKALAPDVITLDVEMPRMNGFDFLERLMRLRPMPVIMVSSRTKERSEEAVRALSMGAVDCFDVARLQADPEMRARFVDLVYGAAVASVSGRDSRPVSGAAAGDAARAPYRWNGRIALIGSSTGGVEALERLLAEFPPDGPPVMIAQHMPAAFLKSFARRLNHSLAPAVRIAGQDDPIRPGEVLIAPGGAYHLVLARRADRVELVKAEPDELYVPSVDRLFSSAANRAPRVVAVILTGMGRDGSEPMLALREAGATTLAQSGESCVVNGMPRAARALGAVIESLPIERLGEAILAQCRRSDRP